MMKRLALVAALGLFCVIGFGSTGCAHEKSHTETDKPGLFGGHKHEETTTYQNPNGSETTEHTEVKTND